MKLKVAVELADKDLKAMKLPENFPKAERAEKRAARAHWHMMVEHGKRNAPTLEDIKAAIKNGSYDDEPADAAAASDASAAANAQ